MNFFKKIITENSGQLLIEMLVTMALSAILIPALLTGLVSSKQGIAQQEQRAQAIALLKEAEEVVRSVREKDWNSFAVNGTYHPIVSGNAWAFATGAETINGFSRSIVISDVYRDTNGVVVTTGGTLDPSTKQVLSTVTWGQPYNSSVTSTSYVTRFLKNAANTQTSAADFNAGTLVSTAVTNTSGGEVTLSPNTKGKWCSPAFSNATIDLPDGPPVAVSAVANASVNTPNDVFVATAPTNASSIKLAYVNVTANTDTPVPSLHGIFSLDPAQYSNSSLLPTGINLTNTFQTTDVKYYKEANGKVYALLATNLPDHEVVAVQINNGSGDSYQDPVNHIYKYWTFFDTKMFPTIAPSIINANFETGSTSPFTTIVNSGVGTNVTTPVHGGTHSAKVTTTKTSVSGISGGGNCSGGVRIPLNPNTTYNWSGYINVPTSGNSKFKDARIRISYYSACTGGSALTTSDSNLITTTGSSWTQVTGSANSGNANFAEIQLLLTSTTNGTTVTGYFDDLSMSTSSSTFSDQAPFGYGAISLTVLGTTGYIDSGGYLYTFDLSNIDSKSPTNGLDQVGCRILLDGYDCKPNSNLDQKYSAGETGASWSDTAAPAHLSCSDGGNIELAADHQLSPVQVGANKYVYVAVGAGTNPEMDIVDTSTPPTGNNLSASTCGRGTNTGWKVTSSLDFDTKSNSEEAANSVYAKSDGTRAYMSSNGGIDANNDGIPDSDQFYVVDTTNKSAPKFLSTSSTTNGSVATSGYYNGNATNIELYPRRALTVLNGQRAIIVGQDGVADGTEPQEYQVLNLENPTEATPTYCGGLNYLPGFNDLTSVSEADGDNFVYMVANTNEKQLKIIQGGPDGNYLASGTYESAPVDLGSAVELNRLSTSATIPTNTTLQFQVAATSPVSGSCTNATYAYIGPDGTNSTYFPYNGGPIPLSGPAGFINPAECVRYKAYLSTTDYNVTPTLLDASVNYSP